MICTFGYFADLIVIEHFDQLGKFMPQICKLTTHKLLQNFGKALSTFIITLSVSVVVVVVVVVIIDDSSRRE